MKKSKFKLKTFVFLLAMATSMIRPLSVMGQQTKTDDFFRSSLDYYESRDDISFVLWLGINQESFNAPLDSGLFIMTAAGLGLAIGRKIRDKR